MKLINTLALVLIVAAASVMTPARVYSTDFYVDSVNGKDDASGKTPNEAWRTSARVSRAEEIAPGDTVRFRSGQVFRGTLRPRSGDESAPVLYTSWGEGPKPRLLRSVSLLSEDAWVSEGDGLWGTRPDEVRVLGNASDFLTGKWSFYQEGEAKISYSAQDGAHEFVVEKQGASGSNAQWFCAPFKIEADKCYRVSFDAVATSSKGISISLMRAGAPWGSYGAVVGAVPESSDPVRVSLFCTATQTASDARLTFYLGLLPEGARVRFSNFTAEEVEIDSFGLAPDVGNIIVDGSRAAWKKWTREDLTARDDFWYDRASGRVFYRSEENPAVGRKLLEAAVMQHIVDLSGVHDAVFDGLDLRYGAAHGFGGSGNARITIRNCDISWIGGGDQYRGGGEGRRVRFGNGIEFWASARDHVVENCRIWEVYDAAITNQGSGTNEERNIAYRGNLIWNCEYSFEYWNRDASSVTDKIRFTDNVCLTAGYGWGHEQRPDKNGRCLMFYSNTAQTTDFVIEGNVFADATESLVRSDVAWTPEQPRFAKNVYWQSDDSRPYVLWRKEKIFRNDFDAFKTSPDGDATAEIREIDPAKLIPKELQEN